MADFNTLTVMQRQTLEIIYPVGCVYMSTKFQNPKDLFGFGEWEVISDKMLLGAGDTFLIGTTGGSTSHSHGLTNGYAMIETSYQWVQYRYVNVSFTPTWAILGTSSTGTPPYAATAGSELGGSTDSASTMPPYEVVYMWKRVS